MVTKLRQLREALEVLSGSPAKQVEYLAKVFADVLRTPINDLTNIDEIGLQFEDATYLLAGLVRDRIITTKAEQCIRGLQNELANLSGEKNPDFWTCGSLKNDHRWEKIRYLAKTCLRELG